MDVLDTFVRILRPFTLALSIALAIWIVSCKAKKEKMSDLKKGGLIVGYSLFCFLSFVGLVALVKRVADYF